MCADPGKNPEILEEYNPFYYDFLDPEQGAPQHR